MNLVSALLLLLLGSLASYSLLSFLLRQDSSILVPERPTSGSLHNQVMPKGGGLVIIVSTVLLIGIYQAILIGILPLSLRIQEIAHLDLD